MALDPKFMIAPSLQEYFVDKDTGLPLANGKVFFYQDDNRSVLKPIYTLSGTPSNYGYTPLSNPVTLNGVGTFSSNETDDVLPYYFPYNELNHNIVQLYYIEVYSSGGVLQFTRQGYPNLGSSSDVNPYGYNFVRNPQFYSWNNTTSFSAAALTSTTDNDFTADDWAYENDGTNQTITISKGSFGTATGLPGSPSNYLIYSSTGGSGQSFNNLYQKYASVLTLSNQQISFGIYLRSTSNSNVRISLTQFFGTGGSPSPSVETDIATFAVTSTWTFFSATVTVPDTTTKTLGTNGDDALYLNINLPLNTSSTINICNVQLQVGSSLGTFPIKSNDDNNKATNYDNPYSIFRTGDTKMTLRNVSDPGWLLMDDGTIGNNASGSSHTGLQYKALYKLLWENVHSAQFAPLYDSSGTYLLTFGATAEDDWNANKRIGLTKALGRVFAGAAPSNYSVTVPITSVTANNLGIPFSAFEIVYYATPVKFSGTLPTSSPQINNTDTYYLNVNGGVYTSASNAVNAIVSGSPGDITFSSPGATSNFFFTTAGGFVSTLGQYYGEENHNQVVPEIASHTHTIAGATTVTVGTGGPSISAVAGSINSGATGGNTAFNIIQPTTYMNVMIKV